MTGWLIDTLIYTGLLIALVLVLRRPVGRTFGPQFAYVLWALPMARLLLPPIVLPAWLAPEPEIASVAASASVAAEPAHFVLAAGAAPAAAPVPQGGWDLLALMGEGPGVLLALWLAGAGGFLLWRVAGYRRMRAALLAEARPVGDVGRIRLVETPAVSAPVAFGVRDKVIALPELFMVRPDREGRDLAIAHELEHHRGHDLLANFAAQALLALHWFNPLAWLGWRAMRRDQEAACDARVVAGRGREERVRYAELIAGIAAGVRPSGFGESLAAPMACPVLGETSIIHRLRSLSMSDITPGRRRLGYGLIAAGALALPMTASISYAAGTDAPVASLAEAPPAPPAPPTPPAPPAPPMAPAPPLPPEASLSHGEARSFTVSPDDEIEGDVSAGLNADDHPGRDFEVRMEAYAEEMERYGEEMERYAERMSAYREAQAARAGAYKARAEAYADAQAARASALAASASVPEVVMNCDEGEDARAPITADGRRPIVICQDRYMAMAADGMRAARAAIMANRAMPAEARAEALRELDAGIAEMARE